MEKYQGSRATLYGLQSAKNLAVVTFLNQVEDDDNYENILPAGLEKVGTFALSLDEVNTDNALALIKKDGKLQCFLLQDEAFKNVPLKTVESLELANLRIKTKIPFQLSSKEEETDGFLGKLLDRINSDSASFLMENSSVVLICNGDKSVLHGAPQDVTVEELAGYTRDEDEEENVKKSKKVVDKQQPVNFKLYWSSVSEGNDTVTGIPQCAPLIYHQKS